MPKYTKSVKISYKYKKSYSKASLCDQYLKDELADFCVMLEIPKSGTKTEIAERILDYCSISSTKDELQEFCELLGISESGTKAQLSARILQNLFELNDINKLPPRKKGKVVKKKSTPKSTAKRRNTTPVVNNYYIHDNHGKICCNCSS